MTLLRARGRKVTHLESHTAGQTLCGRRLTGVVLREAAADSGSVCRACELHDARGTATPFVDAS